MKLNPNRAGFAFALAATVLVSAPCAADAVPRDDTSILAQYVPPMPGDDGAHTSAGPNRQWSPRHDGQRCRHAYGRCRHFYRGYYYETPWWTLPLAIGGAVARHYGDGHVRWCMNRYRSYDPRTDSYLGRDGQMHLCR